MASRNPSSNPLVLTSSRAMSRTMSCRSPRVVAGINPPKVTPTVAEGN